MFVRKRRNRSGSTSVVVIDKSSSKPKELVCIGVSSDEQEIEALVCKANEWILHYGGQTVLDFDGVGKASAQVDEMLDNIRVCDDKRTQLILNKVYDAVGFDAISDDVLRNLVIARICQPGSKMATSAYFKEDLNHWRIYRYMDKLYNTQQETAEARRLPGPGPGVSIMPPVPSSYREKKKENDSKNRSLPHLGCDVGLEPTTPRTTIWCSTN